MNIWYTKVYRPYIAGCVGESGLLLDDIKVHENQEILELMNDEKANRYKIPPHYNALLQPCDVGINKSLKKILRNAGANWRREKYDAPPSGEKIPSPKNKDVLFWLKKIRKSFQWKL